MAKIEEKVTYKDKICKFIKSIGKLSFYSFGEEDEEQILIVDDKKNVLARITACMKSGAYGDYFSGYTINNE